MYGVVVVVVAPRGRRLWDERVDYFSLFVDERRSLGGEYGDLRRVRSLCCLPSGFSVAVSR